VTKVALSDISFFNIYICDLAQCFLFIPLQKFLRQLLPYILETMCVKMTSHGSEKLTSPHPPKSKGNKS